MKLSMFVGAALLAASTGLYAQAPQGEMKGKGERHFDCSQAKDPKACEERVAKMKAAMEKARAACEGKQGEERRACMRTQMCAQSKDPVKCEANARERFEKRKNPK